MDSIMLEGASGRITSNVTGRALLVYQYAPLPIEVITVEYQLPIVLISA